MCKYCEGHKAAIAESDMLGVSILLLPKVQKIAIEIPQHWKCRKRGCTIAFARNMSATVNYCPMCGRDLKREEADG